MFDFIEVEEQIAELRHQFGEKVFDVLGKAFKEIDNTIGKDNLHGFAIATDDYITSLFGMACSTDWINNDAPYPEARSVFVEWPNYISSNMFEEVNSLRSAMKSKMEDLLDLDYIDNETDMFIMSEREQTWKAIIDALERFKVEKQINEHILLLVGSTDPCVPTERLLLESIDRLNSKQVSDVAAKDLGVEKYRKL